MAGKHLDPLAACARIAVSQHGVIGRAQAKQAGLSKDAIYKLTLNGIWTRVRPTVYALWVPSDQRERWYHRLTAGALWLGEGSAASHRAAAVVCELDGSDSAPLEFSTTSERRSPGSGLIVHRVRLLSSDEIVSRSGVAVTTVPRTLVDLASVVGTDVLELALESALRRGLVSREQVGAALDRAGPTHPGRRALRALLDKLPDRRTESALETMAWQLFCDEGIELPQRQHNVRDADGKFVARVDFAFVEARVAVEADGYGSHSKPRDWRRDRARQNALVMLGWIVYRVTWDDVTRRGRELVNEVVLLVASRKRATDGNGLVSEA
jgi:very-short-patch-repair endonuclease